MRKLEGFLSFENVMALAEGESGAHGLADEGLRQRVSGMIDWINGRGPYTTDELAGMRTQLSHVLASRLNIALDRTRFPGIAKETIERPIIVIGYARSGTTLLHSLLAEDPETLTTRGWHTRMPSPPPGAGPIAPGRIAFAQRLAEQFTDLCPAQLRMHPYADEGAYMVSEDEEVYSLDFRNAYPSMYFKVPTLDVMVVIGANACETFQFHREFLQHMQWNTGKSRWVTKTGSAQNNLQELFDVYPDALCVWAHRPIVDIYASNVAVRSVSYDAVNGGGIDWVAQAKGRAEQMKAGIDKMMQNEMIDDPHILHLPFHELTADPVAAVRKVYDRHGSEFTAEYEAILKAWLEDPANRVDRYGRYPYSYEALGLDKSWVQALFADYSERFGLQERP